MRKVESERDMKGKCDGRKGEGEIIKLMGKRLRRGMSGGDRPWQFWEEEREEGKGREMGKGRGKGRGGKE